MMKMTCRSNSIARVGLMAVVLASPAWSGCPPTEVTAPPARPDAVAETLRIDRGENGAASMRSIGSGPRAAQPKKLAFEMAGFGHAVRVPAGDARASATQAAILDAFCKALIEARAGRGQSTEEFSTRISPRLTVMRTRIGGAIEFRAGLLLRGAETTFVLRKGQLQHPPHDLKMIHALFAETNGEFSLLSTRELADSSAQASVGCYVPAAADTALAGDVPDDGSSESNSAPR